jgi:acetyl-CoA carboxylase biotin carboxyl carrier protein
MKLTEDEVIQILKLVEESSFDELHLETGEIKLVVRKKGCGAPAVDLGSMAGNPVSPNVMAPKEPQTRPPEAGQQPKGKKVETPIHQEGLVPIKAPLLGTVYRRPSPDAPPYVDVDSFVKEDDTVCLIEVMKVFTAVKAGVRGQISEILVETNEMVEYGQPLFTVKPGAAEA